MFTDRVDRQGLMRRILAPAGTGDLDGGWKNLLTVFYGVGGVGKTALRKQACRIAREEFPACACVVTDFDAQGWTPETGVGRVFSELCASLPESLELLRGCPAGSKTALVRFRYNLACYECLSANIDETKRLIAEEIALHPEKKEQALKDDDLMRIHEFIRNLPANDGPAGAGRIT